MEACFGFSAASIRTIVASRLTLASSWSVRSLRWVLVLVAGVSADRVKDVTRDRIVCNVRPEKDDPNRVRATVMGNMINHPGDNSTPTADLLTVKILLNARLIAENNRVLVRRLAIVSLEH